MTDSKNFLNEALNGNANDQSEMVQIYAQNSPIKLFIAAHLGWCDAFDTLLESVRTGEYCWLEDAAIEELLLNEGGDDLLREFLTQVGPSLTCAYTRALFQTLFLKTVRETYCIGEMIKTDDDTFCTEVFWWKDPEFAIYEISKFFKDHGDSETLLQDFLRFVPDGV